MTGAELRQIEVNFATFEVSNSLRLKRLATMKDTFEDLLERFELEFANGSAPDIHQFLKRQTNSDHQLLTELVHTELELRLRTGERARVENYVDRFPELSDDRKVLRDLVRTEYNVRRSFDPGGCRLEEYVLRFPEMRQSLVDEFLDASTSSGFGSEETKSQQADAIATEWYSDRIARFRKQKLHEQGGLGNVWLAEDAELDRDVVVKEIKSKYANSASHRARFARETKITGSLEHPGIVPVYGQGFSNDGSPFFAMQFIQGKNLRRSIKQFHAGTNAEKTSREFNRLIQHFIDVCDTIEYAHNQGVIHRDIKPENIMVGQFGETYLIDWGLACNAASRSNEGLAAGGEVDCDQEQSELLSQAGQTIGSPAFMSPEQADGSLEKVTAAADVYGLGATLFSLLTGSENPNRVVVDQKLPRFEQFGLHAQPHLKPLLSVCHKAMATEPADRYSSVQKLREDVENFQLDKQVMAHEESVFERLSRWLRRNRTFLSAAVMTLALVSLVSMFAAFWINSERNRAILARESESGLREKAEASQQQETKARLHAEKRKEQLTNVLGIFADAVAGTDDAGLQISPEQVTARQIVSLLEARVEENDDPIVRALLNTVVARSSRASGDYGRAVAIYKSAIGLLEQEQISTTDPLYVDLLAGLSKGLLATGATDEAAGYIAQVKTAYKQNEEPLAKTYFRTLLAEVKVATRKRDLDRALALASEAQTMGDKIFAESPANSNLMWADYVLGDVYRLRGQSDSAAELFEQVVDAQQQKKELHGLGIAAAVLLSELRFKDDPQRSLELIEQARIDSVNFYGDDHPDAINIAARLGRMLTSMKDDAARNRGVGILEDCHQRMVERNGVDSREAMGVTVLLTESLLSFQDQSKSQRAIEVLRKALDGLEQTSDEGGNFTGFIASFHDRLATAHANLGNRKEAEAAGDEAVAWAIKAYGEDSPVVSKLAQKRDKRNSEIKTRSESNDDK